MKNLHLLSLAVLLAAAPACSDAGGPRGPSEIDTSVDPSEEAKDAGAAGDAAEDAGPQPDAGPSEPEPKEPTLANVYAIFEHHCSVCHITVNLGDLQFTSPNEARAALVNQYARNLCGDKDRLLVVPGNPDGSLLIQKLEDTQDCGTPMPPHRSDAVPAEEIALVRAWIEAGARRN